MAARITIAFLVVLLGAIIFISTQSRIRRHGLTDIKASIASIRGEEVLVIDGQDFPPWAQSHIIVASVEEHVVSVSAYYVNASLFDPPLHRTWPIVLDRRRLVRDTYTIRYWDGSAHKTLGNLALSEKAMTFVESGPR